jgi:hypothetical protein
MKGMGVLPMKVGEFCGKPVSCAVVWKHLSLTARFVGLVGAPSAGAM